jgi:hypothetical protein
MLYAAWWILLNILFIVSFATADNIAVKKRNCHHASHYAAASADGGLRIRAVWPPVARRR